MRTFILVLVVYADLFTAFLVKHTHPYMSMTLLALATACLVLAIYYQIKTKASENLGLDDYYNPSEQNVFVTKSDPHAISDNKTTSIKTSKENA